MSCRWSMTITIERVASTGPKILYTLTRSSHFTIVWAGADPFTRIDRFRREGRLQSGTFYLFCELPRFDSLLPRLAGVRLESVKRQLVVLTMMFALGLQGSWVAFAGMTPLTLPDCQTSAENRSGVSHKPCCSGESHKSGCCLDMSIAAAVVSSPSRSVIWQGRAVLTSTFRSMIFSSRGDSPLIRPPIL